VTSEHTESIRRGGASASLRWVEGSTPYPWPFDGRIEPATLALIVIETRGHAPQVSMQPTAQAAIESLRTATVAFGGHVGTVTTTDPARLAKTSSQADPWTPTFHAAGWDGFFGTGLDAQLRRWGVTHLLLAGAPLETAVHSTMRSANDRGYECLLVTDATAALDPELVPRTLSMIEMSGGIFGANGTTDAVLAQLTR
jgi:biuret amidohydrolase